MEKYLSFVFMSSRMGWIVPKDAQNETLEYGKKTVELLLVLTLSFQSLHFVYIL